MDEMDRAEKLIEELNYYTSLLEEVNKILEN